MKEYTIKVEETVGEFFEEIAGILGKPVADVMCDVLFKRAETSRKEIADTFTVNSDE